ncbi:MAG: hypothetical protein Q9227_008718 [Pyrenula ochraceoflavens]
MPFGKGKKSKATHDAGQVGNASGRVNGGATSASTCNFQSMPPHSPPHYPHLSPVAYQPNWNVTTTHLPLPPQHSPPEYPPTQPFLENDGAGCQWLQAPQTQPPRMPKKWRSYTDMKAAVVQPVKAANHKTTNYISQANKSSTNYINHANKQTTDYIDSVNQRTNDYVTNKSASYLNRTAALYDRVCDKLNDVITCMDEEGFNGDEKEMAVELESPANSLESAPPVSGIRGGGAMVPVASKKGVSKGANAAINTAITSTNYFSKANMYANSRVPTNLPPLHVFIPTYPLLCLAAQYSQRVYTKPRGGEKDTHVEADWRMGTKAMVIKSVPIDDMNTVVFAIRGTQTFMDWAVNLQSAPASPSDFLDDAGNLCHAGFLDVARKMVKPVAARLRQMLEENPSRASCSLLMTGHSAGGAVASLLYCHMLSQVNSELSNLTGCFKRIHCVTFGAPPVSLLPLTKPRPAHGGEDKRLRKSLFLTFINEFDPVPRADKAYIKSLLELYTSPAPKFVPAYPPASPNINGLTSASKLNLSLALPHKPKNKASVQNLNAMVRRPKTAPPESDSSQAQVSNITWEVPSSILSNAGRLVILRVPLGGSEEDVRACIVTDEQLRKVVFGDPLMHQMKVYKARVDILATLAVTGRLNGDA